MRSLAVLLAFMATTVLCAPADKLDLSQPALDEKLDLSQPALDENLEKLINRPTIPNVGKCANKYFFLRIPGTHECVLRHLNAVPEGIVVAPNKKLLMFFNWNTYNYELWEQPYFYVDEFGTTFWVNPRQLRQFSATILGFGPGMTIVNFNMDKLPQGIKSSLNYQFQSGTFVMFSRRDAVELVPVSRFNLKQAYFCTDEPLEQMPSFLLQTQYVDGALRELSGRI